MDEPFGIGVDVRDANEALGRPLDQMLEMNDPAFRTLLLKEGDKTMISFLDGYLATL